MIGTRNMQKALLWALLTPHAALAALQDEGRFTELLAAQEALKTLPFGEVWQAYCERQGVPADGQWYPAVAEYERSVLRERK